MEVKIIPNQIGVLFPEDTLYRDTTENFRDAAQKLLHEPLPVVVVSFAKVKSLLSDGIRTLIVVGDMVAEAAPLNGGERQMFITDLGREVKYALHVSNVLSLVNYLPTLGEVLSKFNLREGNFITVVEEDAETVEAVAVEEVAPPVAPPAAQAVAAQSAAPTDTAGVTGAQVKRSGIYADILAKAAQKEAAKPAAAANPTPTTSGTASIDQLRRIIKAHVPGRICLDVLRIFLMMKKDLVSFDDLQKALHNIPAQTLKIEIQRLITRGTLSSVGGGMYNFCVSGAIRGQITAVANALNDRGMHAEVLKLLTAHEKN
ncbi:hypothetical protein FACS1894139_07660 [Planctomycetales bacterium]|nr:hypothetical protein FACS1894108_09000 [Planctomycetales bacterium]GHT04844.1 hypothetical protein FACS1894139_07660 [Planctomycetales bacterium]